MFDNRDDDQDIQMKDKILLNLIDQMHDILGSGLKSRPGMGVEVQADDPESLKAGIEKAGEVVGKAMPSDSDSPQSPDEADGDDLERLKELFGSDDDDKEDDEDDLKSKFGR